MKDLLTVILDHKNFIPNRNIYPKNVALVYNIQKDILNRVLSFASFENSLLGIDDFNFSIDKNMRKILNDIIFEYKKYHFTGIFLNFSHENHSDFVFLLDELCFRENIPLFVPLNYAKVVSHAKIVIETSISGGNLQQIFEYSILEYGIDRVCAKLSFCAYEFDVPCNNSNGRKLNLPIDTTDCSVFFSESLCTNYFTKTISPDNCVFTIFDDKQSFLAKYTLISNLNIEHIFTNFDFTNSEN